MKRLIFLSAAFAAALALAVPFVGEGIAASTAATASAEVRVGHSAQRMTTTEIVGDVAPSPVAPGEAGLAVVQSEAPAEEQSVESPDASAAAAEVEVAQAPEEGDAADDAALLASWDRLAVRPVTAAATASGCPASAQALMTGVPSTVSAMGVQGTTAEDLAVFAAQFNAIRAANCLPPVTKFIYDSCMEARLFWMAESPSPNPLDAWGHMGSVRSDGVPSVGCDGNLAGGSNNTGATVATKWWDSVAHRNSLYRPGSSVSGVCIAFAMTHGGIDEPDSFVRSAARWVTC